MIGNGKKGSELYTRGQSGCGVLGKMGTQVPQWFTIFMVVICNAHGMSKLLDAI